MDEKIEITVRIRDEASHREVTSNRSISGAELDTAANPEGRLSSEVQAARVNCRAILSQPKPVLSDKTKDILVISEEEAKRRLTRVPYTPTDEQDK